MFLENTLQKSQGRVNIDVNPIYKYMNKRNILQVMKLVLYGARLTNGS